MTREDIKKQFPDATEEQISAILNINGEDIKTWKNKVPKKSDYDELVRKATEFDKLKEADLTDAEKIKKALDDANATKSKYARANNKLEVEKILMAAGMKQEEYEEFIDGLVSEDEEASKKVAQGIADNFAAVKKSTEKAVKSELLKNMPGLDGNGSGQSGDDEEDGQASEAEKVAKTIAETSKAASDSSKAVLDSYL